MYGIVTCPKCKIQVLPKQDGTCPNCHSKIESGKKRKTSLSTKSEKLKRKSSNSRQFIASPSKNKSTKMVSAPNEIQESSGKKVGESKSHAPKATTQTVNPQSAKRRKEGNMFCPSCGKQIPENSTFCLYCGTRIAAPEPINRSVVSPSKQVEWEYRDFVYQFLPPGQGMWAKLGSGAYSEAGAKLEFWQNSQREITAELQKWIDEGWEPVGEVGSSCIEIKTSYSHRDKSPLYWLIFLFFSMPTFGVLFLIALLARSYIAEPIRFVLQMRAPEGTKVPVSSTMRPQSSTLPISTNIDFAKFLQLSKMMNVPLLPGETEEQRARDIWENFKASGQLEFRNGTYYLSEEDKEHWRRSIYQQLSEKDDEHTSRTSQPVEQQTRKAILFAVIALIMFLGAAAVYQSRQQAKQAESFREMQALPFIPTSTKTQKPRNTPKPTAPRRTFRPYTAIQGCAQARVIIGDIAVVADGIPNLFIRSSSDNHLSDNIIGNFGPGERAEIISGPECSWGWIMWKIRRLSDNFEGWVAESDGNEFWLQLEN